MAAHISLRVHTSVLCDVTSKFSAELERILNTKIFVQILIYFGLFFFNMNKNNITFVIVEGWGPFWDTPQYFLTIFDRFGQNKTPKNCSSSVAKLQKSWNMFKQIQLILCGETWK